MSNKFATLPTEKGTKILFQQEAKFEEYDVLYQKWFWAGITAESIIFVTADISDLSDNEIESMVKSSPLVKEDSSITLEHGKTGFTFVNFNFETE